MIIVEKNVLTELNAFKLPIQLTVVAAIAEKLGLVVSLYLNLQIE